MEDKIEDGIKKYNDWWAKYNVGTRVSLMTSLVLLIVVVIYPMFIAKDIVSVVDGITHITTKEIAHYDKILIAVSDNMLWQFMVVTIGANTIVKVAEAYSKFKAK